VPGITTVGEDPEDPRGADAKRGLTARACRARAARVAVHRPDAIADGHVARVRPDGDDDTGSLVPGNDRKPLERETTIAIDEVAVADAASEDANENVVPFESVRRNRDAFVGEVGPPPAFDELDSLSSRAHVSPVRRAISSR